MTSMLGGNNLTTYPAEALIRRGASLHPLRLHVELWRGDPTGYNVEPRLADVRVEGDEVAAAGGGSIEGIESYDPGDGSTRWRFTLRFDPAPADFAAPGWYRLRWRLTDSAPDPDRTADLPWRGLLVRVI